MSSVYAVFKVKTVTSLHFIDGQGVDTSDLNDLYTLFAPQPPPPQHQILHKHCLHSFLGGGERTTVISPL